MIKNIIFDMGNVLLDFNPQVPLDEFCTCPQSRDIIRRELFGGEEWIKRDLGLISVDELYSSCAERVPSEFHAQLRKCVDCWDICMVPLPYAKEFVEYAKNQGYGIYILSNASDDFYRYFPRHFDLSVFDGIVVSADVHLIKPHKEIYLYLLEKYGLNPQECLFIDDREDNVQGAKAVGMQSIRFENDFAAVKDFLDKSFS